MLLSWMSYSLLVSLLLAVAAIGVENLLARVGLPRRVAWIAALVGSVAVPLLAILIPGSPEGAGGTALQAGLPIVTLDPVVTTFAALESDGDLLRPLVLAWIVASAAFAAWLTASAGILRRSAAEWLRGIVQGRPVWISTNVGPAVFGIRRAHIVVPRWLLDRSPSEQDLILAHEESHIRRGHSPFVRRDSPRHLRSLESPSNLAGQKASPGHRTRL